MTEEEIPTAEDIDRMFDEGVDLSPYWDRGSIRQPGLTEEEPGCNAFDEIEVDGVADFKELRRVIRSFGDDKPPRRLVVKFVEDSPLGKREADGELPLAQSAAL